MSHYPITHPLTVIQIGLSTYPYLSAFKHPRHDFIHILAAGNREDRGTTFTDIHVKDYVGNAPIDAVHLEHIIAAMLEEMGFSRITNRGYPGKEKLGFTAEPKHLTSHEKIEAIARVRELLPEIMRRFPQLKETCPDLSKPNVART
jgi:hypothetical protein